MHGKTILLTVFGSWYVCGKAWGAISSTDKLYYSRDTSESDVSTTTGLSRGFTWLYAAPEALSNAPRSRLTDIWGLGCVLLEIVSRLLQQKPSTMRTFWLKHGVRDISYAHNPEATLAWVTLLSPPNSARDHDQILNLKMLSYIHHIVLEHERLLRPAAACILNSLKDMDFFHIPPRNHQSWHILYWPNSIQATCGATM